jgi:hypothetical protein
VRSEITLEEPATVGMIALAGSGVQSLAHPAIGRPRPKAFLHP